MALYILLRGLALLVRCANLPGAHPRLRKMLAATRLRHGDTVLMCLGTMQIAYSWIVLPRWVGGAAAGRLGVEGWGWGLQGQGSGGHLLSCEREGCGAGCGAPCVA